MKRIFVLLCLISAVFSFQLRGDDDVIEVENEGNDTFAGIVINLPEYREIFSGSKILVEYKGEWPLAMKGAFEYAVKLWEENLPMTLPIRITANVGTIKGGGPLSFHLSHCIQVNLLEAMAKRISSFRFRQ